jgi:hypothetical protein
MAAPKQHKTERAATQIAPQSAGKHNSSRSNMKGNTMQQQ